MNDEHTDHLLVTNGVIEVAGYPFLMNNAIAVPSGRVAQRIAQGLDGLKPAVAAQGLTAINVNTTTNNAYLYVWAVDGSVGSVDAIASHIMNGTGAAAGTNGAGLQQLVYNGKGIPAAVLYNTGLDTVARSAARHKDCLAIHPAHAVAVTGQALNFQRYDGIFSQRHRKPSFPLRRS